MDNQVTLMELAEADLSIVKKEDLIDVSGLTFDINVPMEKRPAQILCTCKNPYCFRLGDTGVKLEFAEIDRPFQTAFEDLLKRKKCGL